MRARPSFETVCKNVNSLHKSSTLLFDKFDIPILNKYTDSHQICIANRIQTVEFVSY